MKEKNYEDFAKKLEGTQKRLPLYGQIELTFKCVFNCLHCYCTKEPETELGFIFWKGILDQLKQQGCIDITFTGGDPVLHKDFLKIYDYTRKNGFMINLFTTGYSLTDDMLDFLGENPPSTIEITLNSINKENYELITGVKDTFNKTIENIHKIKDKGLPLILKCNGLKENKHEILEIKKFTEDLLGKGKFKFDSLIFPGLNGEKEPTLHRLGPQEIKEIEAHDEDMIEQREKQLEHQKTHGDIWFNPDGLYHCNSWWTHFYINPLGILQFCHLTDKFSTDLKKEPFDKGFDKFLDILKLKPKTNSKCHTCALKEKCYHCPARAFLETGDEEAPVEYYCRLAELR